VNADVEAPDVGEADGRRNGNGWVRVPATRRVLKSVQDSGEHEASVAPSSYPADPLPSDSVGVPSAS
jgi:hypothetical protein